MLLACCWCWASKLLLRSAFKTCMDAAQMHRAGCYVQDTPVARKVIVKRWICAKVCAPGPVRCVSAAR
jgi:hypothetical protein